MKSSGLNFKSIGLFSFTRYPRKLLFLVFLIISLSLLVDIFISSGADTLREFSSSNTGKAIFILGGIISIVCGYLLLSIVNHKIKLPEEPYSSKRIKPMNLSAIVFYLQAFLIIFVIVQILSSFQYSTNLISAIVLIGYGFTALVMMVLCYKLLSWYRYSKSIVVFLYALTSVAFVLNALASLALFEQLLNEKPEVFTSESIVEFDFECEPGSIKCMLIDFQSYTLMAYFLIMWVSSVLLLSHNIKRLGKPLFFSLTILPIIAFYIVFISAYDELYQISSTISKTETNLIIMLIIIFLGTSCGILYGIGFKSIASRIKSSLDVKDYMILCCYGIILYFIAANSTVAAAGYPPFGISSIIIISIASIFILVGLSNSAIAVAHDANLRIEIKNTISRTNFLDNIGNAERFQDVEKKILILS